MITNHQRDIAEQSLAFALKNGCKEARISIITGENNSFEFRNNQLDRLHRSSESKLFIELYVDGRYGSFSTNRLDINEINKFIKDGISSTALLVEDLCRQLPDRSRYYQGQQSDFGLFDPTIMDMSAQQKKDLAKIPIAEMQGADKRIVSMSSSYEDGYDAEYMIDSNGFMGYSSNTYLTLSADVALKTDGNARAEGFWYQAAPCFENLTTQGVGLTAMERAKRKIGQQKTATGKYLMLVDNIVSGHILGPMISAMYGNALQQKSSFLLDKLNKPIASRCLNLIDNPHQHMNFGARWFDDEGVATKKRFIIENGVLNTYFIDTYNSLKLNMNPTIASPSIISIEGGCKSFDELLSSMDKGIWVTGLNGGNTNSTTGDFSFGIEGFLIEKGEVVQPLGEMNITGNMLQLWVNLLEVGCDLRQNTSWKLPSLLFNDVSFSGI